MSHCNAVLIVVFVFSVFVNVNSQLFRPIDDIFEDIAKFGRGVVDVLLDPLADDPADNMTTLEMIRSEGYPAEAHEVTTHDGYILTLHRIPGQSGSPAVYLQHGLLGSSYDWVLTGKNKSLAFILSDLGYDVWLGNARGNTYSRKHTTLPTNSLKYWTFDWHEMGIYDLPSAITYVTKITENESLVYIGHSMGTTQFYVMASEKSSFAAKKVRAMFSLSPVAFMSHLKSPLRFLAAPLIRNQIEALFRLLSRGELLPHSSFIKFLAKYGCEIDVAEKKICANMLFAICGFDEAQFNMTLLPRVLHDFPAGSSVMTIMHYGQMIESGKFQKYDYGPKENMEKYNQSTPPDYNLSKIKVPIGLFWGVNDWLSNPLDVEKLSEQLRTVILNYKVNFPKFNHLDFLWAIDAPKLVYEKLTSVMEKYR